MWMVVRIPAGDITNLHYNFVVAKPLVSIILESNILSNPILSVYEWKKNHSLKGSVHKIFSWHLKNCAYSLYFGIWGRGGAGEEGRGQGVKIFNQKFALFCNNVLNVMSIFFDLTTFLYLAPPPPSPPPPLPPISSAV